MTGHVLLALEPGQEASWRTALPEAAAEAARRGATLHLIGVVPDFGMSIVSQYFPQDFEKHALENMKAGLEDIAAREIPAGVPWETHVGHGQIVDEILRAAEGVGATLVVLASHKPSERQGLFIGSYADRIVHRCPVSVLVVREA